MPETLEHAKTRALGLLSANKPAAAVCVLIRCMDENGVPFRVIADRLSVLAPAEDCGDVRQWLAELE